MSAQHTHLSKRITVYIDPDLHRLLKHKATEVSESVSDLINESIRLALAEDAADIATCEEREHEPTITFEKMIKDFKKSGKL